jgi:hypothetical protein
VAQARRMKCQIPGYDRVALTGPFSNGCLPGG